MDRSIRIPFRLYLDIHTRFKVPGLPGFLFRFFPLGRKHAHMSIVHLYIGGLLLNLRTPSMAD